MNDEGMPHCRGKHWTHALDAGGPESDFRKIVAASGSREQRTMGFGTSAASTNQRNTLWSDASEIYP